MTKEIENIKELPNNKYFELSTTGLFIKKNTPIEEWLKCGEILKKINGATQWWIGDWINFGEKKYGEKYSQALEATDYSLGTLQNIAYVTDKIESSRRCEDVPFSHYQEIAKLEPKEQTKFIDKIKKNGLSRQELRKEIQNSLKKETIELPKGKFNVIYADPAWEYSNSGIRGAAANHYQTMATEDICKLQIPSAENSVLFLWATNPLIEDAMKVINSWGFQYKTNMVWVKERAGQGFYVKGQHELLLICVKGNMRPDDSIYIRSVVELSKEEHSKKPEKFYEIIETLYPKGKYLELFARNKRKNWTSWGNDKNVL